MGNRAVLYARVSGDDRGKDGRNLAGQLDLCRKYAIEHGWQVVYELAEDERGANSASLELPELNRALELAQEGKFDILVTRELDRFARSLAKQLIVEQQFRSNGVQIEYALGEYPDTPEGNLNKNIKAVIAEYERLKINERMRRGRRLKVQAGNVLVGGHPPYGYRVIQKDGKNQFEICEPEAKLIRMVFEWYTLGDQDSGPLPLRAIVRRLNEMGIPTPSNGLIKGTQWNHTGIHGFLRNETYAGKWHYGKKGKQKNPTDSHIPLQVPPIVSRETWEAAQVQLDINHRDTKNHIVHEYLLRRKLRCGKCGSALHAHAQTQHSSGIYKYYKCYGRRKKQCPCGPWKVEDLDSTIWLWLRALLLNPATLDQAISDHQESTLSQNTPLQERLNIVDGMLDDNQSKLERLLELYLSGNFPEDLLAAKRQTLETSISRLESERSSILGQLNTLALSAEQIVDIKEFAQKVSEGLTLADNDFHVRHRLVELLQVEGIVTEEEGGPVIYATCILGEGTLPVSSDGTCVDCRCRNRLPTL